jgi:hypothetical protein
VLLAVVAPILLLLNCRTDILLLVLFGSEILQDHVSLFLPFLLGLAGPPAAGILELVRGRLLLEFVQDRGLRKQDMLPVAFFDSIHLAFKVFSW